MFKKDKKIVNEYVDISNSSMYTADYILGKALDIGENILRCGGESHRIEDTVERICTAYGAVHTDVFALPSLVVAGIRLADGTTAWYPVAGLRDRLSGVLSSVGSLGYCWSASLDPSSSINACSLYFNDNGAVGPEGGANRSNGASVRCVRE